MRRSRARSASLGACSAGGEGDAGGDDAEAISDEPPKASADGETATAPPPTDPAQLAERITAAGLGCEDFAEDAEPNDDVDRSGSCTLASGPRITIDVLLSRDRYDAYVRLGEDVGCQYYGEGTYPYATGEFWAVSLEADIDASGALLVDADTTATIAQATNGTVASLTC